MQYVTYFDHLEEGTLLSSLVIRVGRTPRFAEQNQLHTTFLRRKCSDLASTIGEVQIPVQLPFVAHKSNVWFVEG